ncbi:EAL domain-containing protein [Frankia sp. Mgl5]|uniref:putative bifunctional diguanylate cyclase/phosphodiesterase n=1 Tax=Frankia sp. Mgl5 TaxID=2933793 RepID=UPI00200D1670|nr:EAL domain-containing protein [Frankia sp. Mgl5]MCK9927064.1 EAL domain-containing protein [Frankia sp. Mgl5]
MPLLLDGVGIAAGLTAAAGCVWTGRRLGRAHGRWLIWVAAALVAWTASQSAWVVDGREGQRPRRPSLADVGYLAMPVLALAALAATPTARARRPVKQPDLPPLPAGVPIAGGPGASGGSGGFGGSDRVRRSRAERTGDGIAGLVDRLLLACSVILVGWGLGVRPALAAAGTDGWSRAVAAVYPAGAVLLVVAALHATAFRRPPDRVRILAAAVGLFLIVASTSWLRGPTDAAAFPAVVGVVPIVGCAFVLLAVLRAAGGADAGDAGDGSERWGFLLVPTLVAGCATATVLAGLAGGHRLDGVEIGLAAVVVAGMVADRLVAARAGRQLAQRVHAAEREIHHRVFHDPLTELANRALFQHRLRGALTDRWRSGDDRSGGDIAILYCDLDDFSALNDSLGPAAGDHLLRTVAQRLRHCVRTTDLVARVGADEFAVLLAGGDESPEVVGERVLAALRHPMAVGGRSRSIRASVGLAVARRTHETGESLLRHAETAVHVAKCSGKNRLVTYRPGMASPEAGAHLADALATALRRGGRSAGFDVHYQPIVRLRDGHPVALEALARWTDPGRGPVPPGTFVAAAENGGMVGLLDDLVLTRACTEVALAYPAGSRLRLHVNVSASRITDTRLRDSVARVLAASRLDPRRLVVEVTETSRIADLSAAADVLSGVRDLGVAIALDDVGAGNTSLAVLHRLPVDVVKLDRTLIESPMDGSRVSNLRRSMIDVAHALGAVVVAEGIERESQLVELDRLGCELGQGFLFARPGPLSGLPPIGGGPGGGPGDGEDGYGSGGGEGGSRKW